MLWDLYYHQVGRGTPLEPDVGRAANGDALYAAALVIARAEPNT